VLSEWREKFLAGAEANLKSREPEPTDDEVLRLKAMVGELMMKNELLAEKVRLLEGNAPGFPWRQSRG
jgi:putative transposase